MMKYDFIKGLEALLALTYAFEEEPMSPEKIVDMLSTVNSDESHTSYLSAKILAKTLGDGGLERIRNSKGRYVYVYPDKCTSTGLPKVGFHEGRPYTGLYVIDTVMLTVEKRE